MRRFHLSSLLVVLVLASGVSWTACKPKPKVTTPTGPTREQIERARADSLRAAQEAERLARERAEAEQRQREEAERRRREAEEAARRAAAEAAQKKTLELKMIYFDYDKSNIRDDQRSAIDENAKSLKEYQAADKILVEGHCDERGTVEYNLALGERRANSVRKYLTDSGVDKKRVSTISYGKNQPADPGHDESAWWKNRRAELKRQK
ncbi:MAG: peptidoglycan-associated lipoprotein Pal [Candidatus Latescibacteria bacterium]|nr:peptidoglycan-associated lipoprotein Pal [Candidatus Latescibacterota bacterium]